jgi:hypothetical protein
MILRRLFSHRFTSMFNVGRSMFEVPLFLHRCWSILLQTAAGASRSRARALFLVSCLWLLSFSISPAIIDSNENGLTDLWEDAYFNTSQPPGSQAPTADPDSDGWTNLQEATAGTDPFSANPPAGIVPVTTAHIPEIFGPPELAQPPAIAVTWPTIAGKVYTLFCSTDLTPGSWIPFAPPFIGDGTPMGIGHPLTTSGGDLTPSLFWRVAISDTDTDEDTLTDAEEHTLGTDPDDWDSDDDYLSDAEEHALGTNLHDPDSDGDGAPDWVEVESGTNPNSSDSRPPCDPKVRYEGKLLKGTQNNLTASFSSNYQYRLFPPAGDEFTFFSTALNLDALHTSITNYAYRPYSETSGEMSLYSAFLKTSQMADGTPNYGPAISIYAISHDISHPDGAGVNRARVVTNGGLNLRLENPWDAPEDTTYQFLKIHLKAPMPNRALEQGETTDSLFWKIPAADYVIVEADTEMVQVEIKKDEKLSQDFELAPPIVGAGYCHLVGLLPVEVKAVFERDQVANRIPNPKRPGYHAIGSSGNPEETKRELYNRLFIAVEPESDKVEIAVKHMEIPQPLASEFSIVITDDAGAIIKSTPIDPSGETDIDFVVAGTMGSTISYVDIARSSGPSGTPELILKSHEKTDGLSIQFAKSENISGSADALALTLFLVRNGTAGEFYRTFEGTLAHPTGAVSQSPKVRTIEQIPPTLIAGSTYDQTTWNTEIRSFRLPNGSKSSDLLEDHFSNEAGFGLHGVCRDLMNGGFKMLGNKS